MKWTLQKPTTEGWYWFREKNMEPEVVHLCLSRDDVMLEVQPVFAQGTPPIHVSTCDGEWFGPLEPPPFEERESQP
jgi:hypothetical protein